MFKCIFGPVQFFFLQRGTFGFLVTFGSIKIPIEVSIPFRNRLIGTENRPVVARGGGGAGGEGEGLRAQMGSYRAVPGGTVRHGEDGQYYCHDYVQGQVGNGNIRGTLCKVYDCLTVILYT